MIFDVKYVDPDSPLTKRFRERWIELVGEENEYLSRKAQIKTKNASPMQVFVVNTFTGLQPPNEEGVEEVLVGVLPAQMELEAIFRARSRALAEALGPQNAQG